MKRILLEPSDYDCFTYPAGELQVRLRNPAMDQIVGADQVSILARILGSHDVLKMAMLSSAVEGLNRTARIEFILPYLPYARADRRFVVGDCFGLEVFGNILASCAPTSVLTLDAHSDISRLKIPNLTNASSDEFITKAIGDFTEGHDHINILYPDEGAAQRYRVKSCYFKKSGGVVTTRYSHATKKRDPATGKFLGFTVPEIGNDYPVLIIDDICDGGGTFKGIAEALQDEVPRERLGLYVTHGIFSKGPSAVSTYFSKVYCTNSISDSLPWSPTGDDSFGGVFTMFDCIPDLLATPRSEV